jgi:hypothetical protein
MLVRSVGQTECVLNRTWGFGRKGVWVARGCGGQFLVAPDSFSSRTTAALRDRTIGGFQFAFWTTADRDGGTEFRRVLVQTDFPQNTAGKVAE